ncbi:MAG: hypothetical protein ACJ761_01465 [Chloroflexota bacterium]
MYPETTEVQEGEIEMNPFAIIVVNDHIETLRRDAAQARLVKGTAPSLRQRIAATVSGLKDGFAAPLNLGPVLPPLNDYPYRG